MIVSASYRTDIPALFGTWFMNRLHAGYVRVFNPYGGRTAVVPLTREAVDGFVFWSRNIGPFFPALEAVAAAGHPFVVQYTITGYPRELDAATIAPERAVGHFHRLITGFGPATAVWRYDPIVFTSRTQAAWHRRNFLSLLRALPEGLDEVVVSFAHIYRKTERNLAAACASRFDWWDPPVEEKRSLLADLAEIAARRGVALTLCAQSELLVDGVGEARCIDAERLSRVAGRTIHALRRPHRKTCGCWSSRDIGAYDSCTQGCAYCYAVGNRAAAKRRLEAHDPAGDFLIPPQPKQDP